MKLGAENRKRNAVIAFAACMVAGILWVGYRMLVAG